MTSRHLGQIADYVLGSVTLGDEERRFCRGMKALLENGKTLTERQENRLIVLGARAYDADEQRRREAS